MTRLLRITVVLLGVGCLWVAGRSFALRNPREFLPHVACGRAAWFLGGLASTVPSLRYPVPDNVMAQRVVLGGGTWPVRWSGCNVLGVPADVGRRIAGLRLLFVTAGLVLAGTMVMLAGVGGVPCGLAGAVLLSIAVDAALVMAARAGREAVASALPVIVETLSGTLTAGLPVERAIRVCVASAPAGVAEIFGNVVVRTRTGTPAASAFRIEARRTGVTLFLTVALTVERAIEQGAPVDRALSSLSAELGARMRVARQVRAGRNGPYAALLTAMVIAPSCIGILLVYVVGGFLASGRPG